jgi:spermidine synthase
MSSGPVAALLIVNLLLFLSFLFRANKGQRSGNLIPLTLLFFFSGMPALVYQVVWQRALFLIYGVNAQSVAVVVTAFMLGLGAGNLLGGYLSSKRPRDGVLIFAAAEIGIGIFGLCSLRMFHWIGSYTAGASLGSVILFSLALLLLPTVLMGMTLPILVAHLVRHANQVGVSVSLLYFVNTFGSAVACYLCATFLLKDLGQAGSVTCAACANIFVGLTAYLFRRAPGAESAPTTTDEGSAETLPFSLGMAALLAGVSGFIALGFEIVWYRVFAIASSDRAPAFALLLSTYLAGIAAGAYVSEQWANGRPRTAVVQAIGALLLGSGLVSAYLPPLVATLRAQNISFLFAAPAFYITAALMGSVFPLLCQVTVSSDEEAGRRVSYVYVSNILGSAIGSLGIGFVGLQYVGLKAACLGLAVTAVVFGSVVLVWKTSPPVWAVGAAIGCILAITASSRSYALLYERLIFGQRAEASVPFAHLVENRNGIVGVTKDAAVFGGGVYDGYFNVDPLADSNLVARIYALSAFAPHPKSILVVGLASGSWGQILANHPQVESLDAVEINPGYLQLIPQYACVSSFLGNPKVHVYVDDGRRWLLAHPEARYDAIVVNSTFHWRDHSSTLLSQEFLGLARQHLNPGGVYYFNSTESDEAIATSLRVFPYALRVINFVAVSDSPINLDKSKWLGILREYKLDGRPVFDSANPRAETVLTAYMALADTVNQPPRFLGMESGESLRARLRGRSIITDDNMGMEWKSNVQIPWH